MTDPKQSRKSQMPIACVKEDGSVNFSPKAIVMILASLGIISGGSGALAKWGITISNGGSETTINAMQNTRLNGHDTKLKGLTATIGKIQGTQHWQVADQAAARLCAGEPAPTACEKRIIRWSIEKLKKPGETKPCTTLACQD